MNIYEKRTRKKRTTLCSYCGRQGHLWVTCPYPSIHREQVEQGQEIDVSVFAEPYRQRYSIRNKVGGLCSATFLSERAVEFEKKQKIRGKKSIVRKTKRRCGFCNSPSHNRKNCKVMKSMVDDLALANQNYRRRFYQSFIKDKGIAEGALVNIKAHSLRLSSQTIYVFEGIGIITMIDWEAVNLGLASTCWSYASNLKVDVLLEGETYSMTSPFKCGSDEEDIIKEPLIAKSFSCPNSVVITSVLSPSLSKPTVEWFEEGYDNCWKWITNNRNLHELTPAVAPLLEAYYPKQNQAFHRRLARYKKK